MGVVKFHGRSFRAVPATACRMSRALRFIFAERKIIPATLNVPSWQTDVIIASYGVAMPGEQASHKKSLLSRASALNLIATFSNTHVRRLYPWVFSSMYVFAYFVFKHRHSRDEHLRAAYLACRSEETKITIPSIRAILGIIIGDEMVTPQRIDNIRSLLRGVLAAKEMKAVLSRPTYFYLGRKYRAQEDDMRLFFKFFEVPEFRVVRMGPRNLLYDLAIGPRRLREALQRDEEEEEDDDPPNENQLQVQLPEGLEADVLLPEIPPYPKADDMFRLGDASSGSGIIIERYVPIYIHRKFKDHG